MTRVIFACAAGQGELFVDELAGLGAEIVAAEEPERLGRGGGIKFAARAAREQRRRLRAERRRARSTSTSARCSARHRAAAALATIAVAQPKSQFGVVEVDDERRRPRLRGGGPRPVLGQLRPLRALRRGDRAVSRTRRPRVDDVPGARRRGPAACLPPRRPLADGEHAEGAARRRAITSPRIPSGSA